MTAGCPTGNGGTLQARRQRQTRIRRYLGYIFSSLLGIPYCVAVVDAGSHLVAFLRQDGALIGSIDLAIDKAATARIFDKTTSDLATLAQSGKPLFGIQESNAGKVVI